MAKFQLSYANTLEFEVGEEHVKAIVDAQERGDRQTHSRILQEHATNQKLIKASWEVEQVAE